MRTIIYEGEEFPIVFCEHCERDVVICHKCGNNTCNGGYGTLEGKDCPHCSMAYAASDTL